MQPATETITVPANVDSESQVIEKSTRKHHIAKTCLAACLGLLLGALLAALITYFALRHSFKEHSNQAHSDKQATTHSLDNMRQKHWSLTPDPSW
jgi:predicted histidine transporter YuiF (NhaC family)